MLASLLYHARSLIRAMNGTMMHAAEQDCLFGNCFSGRLSWRWRELRTAPREPVSREADPFVDGRLDSLQPIAHYRKPTQSILTATCAPIDR